jgi:hypothetical protein
VDFAADALQAIHEIIVGGDGDGITTDQAMRSFGSLGGSWKLNTRRSRTGRPLHGRRGHGRWAAFALGEMVTWTSVADAVLCRGPAVCAAVQEHAELGVVPGKVARSAETFAGTTDRTLLTHADRHPVVAAIQAATAWG